MASFTVNVNGSSRTVDADPDCPLLFVLQEDFQLNSAKFGCGLSQCGACTVMLNGEPVRSCVTPMSDVAGPVLTVESLGTMDKLHPLQRIFIEEQAVQCAFCVSGVIWYGKTFMDKNPRATESEISEALSGVLCRCHTHVRMIRALQRYGREAVR